MKTETSEYEQDVRTGEDVTPWFLNDDRRKDDDRIGHGTEWRVELSENEKNSWRDTREANTKTIGYR